MLDDLALSMEEKVFLKLLAAKIKQVRVERNLTQNEVALRCDIERSNYARIESGEGNVTVVTLLKLSMALEIEFTSLFDFTNSEASQ